MLAAGLVLGVGGAVTLAAWTDTERVTGSFTSGTFGVEGTANGTTWIDQTSTGTPAALSFQLPPTAMVPGTTTYALFGVRTRPGSVAGNVSLTAGTPTGQLASYLRVGVRVVSGTPTPPAQICDAQAFSASSTVIVPSDSVLSQPGTATHPLATNGTSPVYFCFAITLPANADNAAQGKTAAQTWTFTGSTS